MATGSARRAQPAKKGPRQQSLEGIGDARIEVLEDKALQYAEVRDERIGLSQKEGELKGQLLDLMKAQKREHYQRGNIRIDIVHEKENIKVKVKAGGGGDEDDDDEEAAADTEKSTVTVESATPLSTAAGREGRVVAVPPAAKSGPKQLAEFHKQQEAKGAKKKPN
jgi:hypothetical protein